jgi:hypothetical protein
VKVRWLHHPFDSSLNGTEEDLRRTTAQGYVDVKAAELVPPKNRVEYMRQLEEERAASAPKPPAPVTSWGVRVPDPEQGQTGKPYILGKCSSGEIHRFHGRPEDARHFPLIHSCGRSGGPEPVPDYVVAAYKAALEGPTPQQLEAMRAGAAEAAQRERYKQEAAQKGAASSITAYLARIGMLPKEGV